MQLQKLPKLLAKAVTVLVVILLLQQVIPLLQVKIHGLLQMQVQAGMAQTTKLPFKKEDKIDAKKTSQAI
jgi:hypothetical protein